MPSFPPGWPDLNRDQETAVTASMDPQLVVAGPGTGKTRVLVCRAAYLIDVHNPPVTPSNLVLITFTRRAAGQLTNRLAALVGPDAQHVRAGTIHHFCFETLRTYVETADVPTDFIVVDDAVADAFWQRWYEANRSWCDANDFGSYRQVKTYVSRIKLGIDPVSGRLNDGLRAYDDMLAERGALDFDDLLVKTRDLLRDHPDASARLANDTQAILVDEFQDTDPVQFNILRRLGEEAVHLYCVADDDQSIYRFRGARPENIRRYIDRFNCTTERGTQHVLSTNYRSNRSIFAVAETVLKSGGRLKQRGDIQTQNEDAGAVPLVACADAEAEREYVLQQVQNWTDEDVDRSEIAVLTRWNRRLAALEADFLRAGMACQTSSDEELLEAPPARKLQAFLRVLDARRRDRPVDAPMTNLLEQMLSDDVTARLQDFRQRHMPDESAWTAFQTLVSDKQARENAGLAPVSDRLNRAYATIRNLLQSAQEEGRTIGAFTGDALDQLGDPLQLLLRHADTLTDPNDVDSIRAAGPILKEWLRAQRADEPPRFLLHHRTAQITRLWRQLVRRALDIETDPPAPLPEAQEALLVRPVEEGIPPLGADDVVVTTDLEALLQWADRTEAFPETSGTPHILLLRPEGAAPSEQLQLLGLDPACIHLVDREKTFHSPSVRLFKLLQQTTGPRAPEPLFPEYVMVDLEATSLDPRRCRVAEIGALKVQNGSVEDRFSELVDLPNDLTEDERETIRSVCGLDPDTDFEDARPRAEVWDAFCDFVGTAPLVAHNGQQYDFRVLHRLSREHDSEARWATTYDLLPVAHELFPDLRRYTAAHLRDKLLDDDRATAHRALADCEDQQRILERMQQERARRHRILAHEALLPLVVAALTYESPAPEALSTDGQVALQVGHTWALRDASPAGEDLRSLLPRSLPDRLRQHALYRLIDEDALLTATAGLQPGLADRLSALFSPYADEPLWSEALDDLLTHLALWGEETVASTGGSDVITLSTYHSAKGLEFERVICMDVHDNAFPPYFARDPEERRESRRLLYVGMTRAERHLVLTYPRHERGFDRRPSPFLDDAPDGLLRTVESA